MPLSKHIAALCGPRTEHGTPEAPGHLCQGAAVICLEAASHRNFPPIFVGFPSIVPQALVSPDSKPSAKISKDPLPM